MPDQSNPPPTFIDIAFDGARDAAVEMILAVPELRSVEIVFDWAVPLGGDVPPGIALTRGVDGGVTEVRHPLPLFGLLQQHGRMGLSLATRFQQLLAAADETAAAISARIHERQQELDAVTEQNQDAERYRARLALSVSEYEHQLVELARRVRAAGGPPGGPAGDGPDGGPADPHAG